MKNITTFLIIFLGLLFINPISVEAGPLFNKRLPNNKSTLLQKRKAKIGTKANAMIAKISRYISLTNGGLYTLLSREENRTKRWKSGDPISLLYKGKSIYSAYNLRTKDLVHILKFGK